ncbi:uncharacterized protein EDB91DRAFT_609434 [Suillus paluster]|uniref:uncharacterized protein n=1 Tax=Suillus paluster TaxID=48578 RepID=UPI001B8760FC|nr:uncharacterized protein EDB91DRAFT_609434 [Suillus paluster]KAG1751468.1 hypothetical protein EDB91DRAFT_609434 [Suillus paluster]
MHRALISLSIGDSDKPSFSPFVPPPIQRLSLPPSSASKSSPNSTPPALPRPKKSQAPTKSPSPVAGPSNCNASAIFPYLHRLEIHDDMASRRQQRPLLVLKLSSPSFLDSVATDVVAETPLYSVETVGSSTTVWRSDPWGTSVTIADIRWPKDIPLKGKGRDTHGSLIQMGDPRWKDTDSYLKYGSLRSSRKFSLPNHPHVLKWKRTGRTYQCTTSSSRGPIASLDASQDEENTPRLKVFETIGPIHQSVPQVEHAGISLSLLDNLFVTALLLVTEPDDWMTLRHNPDTPATDSVSPPKSSAPASARQWRKIMYGEPLYPSLKTPAVDTRCNEDADVLDISGAAPLPTSVKQWRKIVYGEPLYPSLRPHSADGLDLPSRPDTAWDTASISSESVCYPATPSSAPSTGFYTSTFFDESERTVPRIDTNGRYSAPLSFSPATISPIPASDCMPLSSQPSPSPRAGTRRELPAPPSAWHGHPPPGSQPWLHRSRSSPRLSCMLPTTIKHSQLVTEDGVLVPSTPLDGDEDRPAETPPSRSRALSSGSVVRRRLPTVPSTPTSPISSPPPQTKRLFNFGRTLPPTPVSIPRSPSAGHRYTHSSNIISRTPSSATMPARPSTAQQPRRNRPEKDPDEVLGWVRNVTRAHHHRRALDCDELEHRPGCPEEAPPPAYNAIDFSKPPQSRALPNPS